MAESDSATDDIFDIADNERKDRLLAALTAKEKNAVEGLENV